MKAYLVRIMYFYAFEFHSDDLERELAAFGLIDTKGVLNPNF